MRQLIIGVGVLAVLVVVATIGVFVFSSQNQKPKQESNLVTEVEPPEISLRPFFSFAPRGDGKAIQISITGILEGMEIDYEIIYTTGAGLQQGIGGPVAVEEGESFFAREHIFGTCSKNVCTYDTGVEFGEWQAKVRNSNQIYNLSGDWRLQRIGVGAVTLGFEDEFEMGVSFGTFSKSAFVITTENASLPKKLPEGTRLVAGPFTVSPSDSLEFKREVQISFFGATGSNLQILRLSPGHTDWEPAETRVDTTTNSSIATTSTLGTFVLVEQI